MANDDDVIRGIGRVSRAVEIAHDGAIVLGGHFYVNSGFTVEFGDQSSLGKGLQEPFVTGQTKSDGRVLLRGDTCQHNKNECKNAEEGSHVADQWRWRRGVRIQFDYRFIELLENHRNFTGASPVLMLECVMD